LVGVDIAIVDPEGFVALRQGTFSQCGNRGPIDRDGELRKQHNHQNWIYCVTSALENPEDFMKSKTYTDLFFLDEATALSAGHRPCGKCNRSRHDEYLAAWGTFDRHFSGLTKDIDEQLRYERADDQHAKRTYLGRAQDLPDGTMVRLSGKSHLLTEKFAYPWSLDGYGVPVRRSRGEVEVLTPPSTVKVLDSGRFKVSTENLVMKWA
jgi:hypothetical protein